MSERQYDLSDMPFTEISRDRFKELEAAERDHAQRMVGEAISCLAAHLCPTPYGYKPTCRQKIADCKGTVAARVACWSDYLDAKAKEAPR
jgi:hypothetical protein